MLRCRFPELALVCVASSAVARAEDPAPLTFEARLHVEQGLAAYREGRYSEAIRELSAAYTIEPRREILFNWAQAERLSGDCDAAVPLYEKFIGLKPPQGQIAQARRLIEKCGGTRKAQIGPTPQSGDRGDKGAKPERPKWYQDTWGDAMVGVGLVGLAVGATFYALSQKGFDDARGASNYQDYDARWDQARNTRRFGVVGLVVGGSLVAAGVARWVWIGMNETEEGGMVVVGGRF